VKRTGHSTSAPRLRRGDGWHVVAVFALLAIAFLLPDPWTMPATQLLSLLGFLLFALSMWHMMARTGKVTNRDLWGERSDRFEALLRLYAVPLLVGSILIGLARA
jgi:hypothetical protein